MPVCSSTRENSKSRAGVSLRLWPNVVDKSEPAVKRRTLGRILTNDNQALDDKRDVIYAT